MPSKLQIALPLLALAGVAAVLWFTAGDPARGSRAGAAGATAANGTAAASQVTSAAGAGMANFPGLPAGSPQAQRLADARRQLEQAEFTYNNYKATTRYPQESRPAAEHADWLYPNKTVDETRALHTADGRTDTSIQVKTSQSRVWLAEKESVVFALAATDAGGNPVPLSVSAARINDLPAGKRAPLAVTFNDDGQNGDAQGADGTWSARFAPSETGLADYAGTLRLTVQFLAAGKAGIAVYDVITTPQTPAIWTGAIREAQEGGSLNFYLQAKVNLPGRYVIAGRVDDASGKPFALLSFNDELKAGTQEIRLQVFGKLIRDANPAFPLVLRDVDGYLLKENTDPDRALMPRWVGKVTQSKKYPPASFSDAEWAGEQRTRYLNEYGKDVAEARAVLDQAQK